MAGAGVFYQSIALLPAIALSHSLIKHYRKVAEMAVIRFPQARRKPQRTLPKPRLTREDAKQAYARTQMERELLQLPSRTHPWAIVQVTIAEKSIVLRRFANRQDAEDFLRIFARISKIMEGYHKQTTSYSLCFDAPVEVSDE
jgi:hypothetical protein